MKNHREPILYDGLLYVIPLTLLSLLIVFLGRPLISLFTMLVAAFIAFFFRNPERGIPQEEGIIVSPADGKVILIQDIYEKGCLNDKAIKLSIFLSLIDVHINRIPCSGEVVDVNRKSGNFLAAFKDEASIENESISICISHNKHKILVKQIAGLLARRIICWVNVGDKVERGQRYGLIKFGSRIDIFLPPRIELKVKIGDKVKGGETILGVLK